MTHIVVMGELCGASSCACIYIHVCTGTCCCLEGDCGWYCGMQKNVRVACNLLITKPQAYQQLYEVTENIMGVGG